MPSPKRQSSGGYLRGVLASGARPFPYRARVGALLGATPGHTGIKSAAQVPPVAFRYPTVSDPFAPHAGFGNLPVAPAGVDGSGLPSPTGDGPVQAGPVIIPPDANPAPAADSRMQPAALSPPTPDMPISVAPPSNQPGSEADPVTRLFPRAAVETARLPRPAEPDRHIEDTAASGAETASPRRVATDYSPPANPPPWPEPESKSAAPAQPSPGAEAPRPSRQPDAPVVPGPNPSPVRNEAGAAAPIADRARAGGPSPVARSSEMPGRPMGPPAAEPLPPVVPAAPLVARREPPRPLPDRVAAAGAPASKPGAGHLSARPGAMPARQQESVARLEAAVAGLWSKASTGPAGRQTAAPEPGTTPARGTADTDRPGPATPPQTILQPIYVNRPATRNGAPRAFWERSYLGSLRLRSLR